MTSSLCQEVRWPTVPPPIHNFHQLDKQPKKCPKRQTCILWCVLILVWTMWSDYMCFTWSHSDCNIVPTSSMDCCCCTQWSAGRTSRDSSSGNSSASCSSPDTDPESRCNAALLQALCDTRVSISDRRRNVWAQQTLLASVLQKDTIYVTTHSSAQLRPRGLCHTLGHPYQHVYTWMDFHLYKQTFNHNIKQIPMAGVFFFKGTKLKGWEKDLPQQWLSRGGLWDKFSLSSQANTWISK